MTPVEKMTTEELVRRLRKRGIWNAPDLWEVLEASADRLETILKAWAAIQDIHDADWMQQYAELRRAITGDSH